MASVDTSLPLPQDLAKFLLCRTTPWMISKSLFERMLKQGHDPLVPAKPFTACEVQQSDPEYSFALK